MSNCPDCGKDTSTEPAAPAGTIAAGSQLYRTRRQGVRIDRGSDTGTDVTPRGSDAA
ncbi:hypothetical protein ACN267_32130 [Micromonospora sp. WMMD734]|uniref:hypothetical protein n=1 Tax=Micromonospora sp. WMMD734 TaxID=3404129 RepID=UPI003B955FB7